MDSVIKTIITLAILGGLLAFSVLYVPKITTMYNVHTPAVYTDPSYSNPGPPDYNYSLEVLHRNLTLVPPAFNALWQNMTIVNCSNPVAQWVIGMVNNNTLNNATYMSAINQSLHGYNYQYAISIEAQSLNASSKYCYVKLGLIKLPYGLGLIILGYGSYYSGYDIDIVETVINSTQFLQLLEYAGIAGVATYIPPDFPDNGVNNFTGYALVPLWHKIVIGWGNARFPTFYVETVSYMLESQIPNGVSVGSNIGLENLEWDLNEPAVALAYYLTYGNNSPINYELPLLIAENFFDNAYGGVSYKYITNQPYTTVLDFVFNRGGVCADFTEAYSMFVSNYLGAPTADIVYPNYDHELAVLLMPYNYSDAEFNLTLYGINYSGSVLADTAHFSYNMISNPEYGGQLQIEAPLLYSPIYDSAPNYTGWVPYIALTGIPQAILNMPPILQTPWLIHFKNLTEKYLNPSIWDNQSIGQYCQYIHWYLDSLSNVNESLEQHYLLFIPPGYNQTAVSKIKVLMNFDTSMPSYAQITNIYNNICNITPVRYEP